MLPRPSCLPAPFHCCVVFTLLTFFNQFLSSSLETLSASLDKFKTIGLNPDLLSSYILTSHNTIFGALSSDMTDEITEH